MIIFISKLYYTVNYKHMLWESQFSCLIIHNTNRNNYDIYLISMEELVLIAVLTIKHLAIYINIISFKEYNTWKKFDYIKNFFKLFLY